jgi:hypothetical protein
MAEISNRGEIPLAEMTVISGGLGAAFYFGLVYVVTRYSYRANVGFGLACSLVLAQVGLIFVGFGYQFIRETQATPGDGVKPFLIPLAERFFKQEFKIDQKQVRLFSISGFPSIFTLFISSWASLAYGFARVSPSAYAHPEQLSFGLMFWHYVWQLVDMIPLVDVWKNVHLEDPLLETRIWPGLLVVIFRLIVLYIVVAAAAKLLGIKKRTRSGE